MVSPAFASTNWPSSSNSIVFGPAPSPLTMPIGWVWVMLGPPSGTDPPPALPLASWPYPCGFGLSLLISKPRRRSRKRTDVGCSSLRGLFRRKFLGEIFNHASERIRGRLAQPADRRVAHRLAQFSEQLPVPHALLHQQRRLLGTDAAWRALPAALVLEETHQVQRGS